MRQNESEPASRLDERGSISMPPIPHSPYINGVFVPCSEEGFKMVYQNEGKTILLKSQTPRDIDLHKCYHLFCRWLWEQMPLAFKQTRCPDSKNMYQYA